MTVPDRMLLKCSGARGRIPRSCRGTALASLIHLGAVGAAGGSRWSPGIAHPKCWCSRRYLGTYCRPLANAAETVGPLGHDIIAKIVCKQGVGHIMEADTPENHMVRVRGPITLRYLRFRPTDYEGNLVNLRGTSVSFCVYLDG